MSTPLRPKSQKVNCCNDAMAQVCAFFRLPGEKRRKASSTVTGLDLFFSSPYWHGGPASVRKVPLSESHPWRPSDGFPKNQEKNASSCKW